MHRVCLLSNDATDTLQYSHNAGVHLARPYPLTGCVQVRRAVNATNEILYVVTISVAADWGSTCIEVCSVLATVQQYDLDLIAS